MTPGRRLCIVVVWALTHGGPLTSQGRINTADRMLMSTHLCSLSGVHKRFVIKLIKEKKSLSLER